MRLVSLLYIVDGDLSSAFETSRVLLGKKKVRFGAGYWNGFGGGVEEGESIEESACRETKEECGLTVLPQDISKVAHITFNFEENPDYNRTMHVFITNKFSGKPVESEEMLPQWFTLNEFPLNEMWPSDSVWVPLVLKQGKKIEGECFFIGSEKPFRVGKFKYKETEF